MKLCGAATRHAIAREMDQLILELDQETGIKQQHRAIDAAAAQRLALRRLS